MSFWIENKEEVDLAIRAIWHSILNDLITLPIQSSIAAGMYVFEISRGEQSWEVKVVKEEVFRTKA